MPSELSCKEIIDEIQKGGVHRERCMYQVYKQFRGFVFKLKNKYHLSVEEVEDGYAEAISEFANRVDRDKFELRFPKSCSTFIYTVCQNKCFDYLRNLNKNIDTIDIDEIPPDMTLENFEDPWKDLDREVLKIAFQKLSEKCQNVLIMWASGYSMKEIYEANELKDENSAAVTRHACLKKLRGFMDDIDGE